MEFAAITVTVPMNPEHWAMPVIGLMLTPAGAMVEFGIMSDHVTGTVAVMGAMLKFPMALNWTMPEGKFMALAVIGVTVMLSS
jgi:hypothetical protein